MPERDAAPPTRIPLAAPNVSDEDRAAVSRALEDTRIAYGPVVDAFEDAVAAVVGVPHAVAVTSGTAALHLALLASGVSAEDEVLLPSLTYVAPASAVRYAGAHPVLLDSEPRYGQLDLDRAAAFVERTYARRDGSLVNRHTGRRLAALLVVHLLGHPADLDHAEALAERFGIPLIEDAAEAFGAGVRGRRCGSAGLASVLSFNANKTITTGGGGMLLTADAEVAARARLLASHGKRPGSLHYHHDQVGFNYRLASPQAALGLSQLSRLDDFLASKRSVAARYSRAFRGSAVAAPAEAEWARATFWLYTVQVPAGQRDRVMHELIGAGIECRPVFEPVHRVGAHAGSQADDCAVAERLSAGGLCLPCSTDIEDDQVGEVAATLLAAVAA